MRKFLSTVVSDLEHHQGKRFWSKILIFFFNYNFRLVYSFRFMKLIENSILHKLNVIFHLKQSLIFNSYISPKAEIGSRLKFAHAYGVIIGQAKIGNNVTIFQQVTIGSHGNSTMEKSWPTIGDNCKIYSGAKILGNVKIGNNCTIGANCVVLKNLPDNAIVMSPPSKIVGYNESI